jgi:putative membrane protein insertion efficiency factor
VPSPRSGRRWGVILTFVLVSVLVVDLARPPDRQWSAWLALGGIALYQRAASPWVARAGVACRFTPTCSRYAAATIARDGALKGGAKTAVRLLRCGPWTPAGTVDEP